jgi:hypothetical protein
MSNVIKVQYQYPVGIPVIIADTSEFAQILGHTNRLLVDGDYGDDVPLYVVQLTEDMTVLKVCCEYEIYPSESNDEMTDVKRYPAIIREYHEDSYNHIDYDNGDYFGPDENNLLCVEQAVYVDNGDNTMKYVCRNNNTGEVTMVPV